MKTRILAALVGLSMAACGVGVEEPGQDPLATAQEALRSPRPTRNAAQPTQLRTTDREAHSPAWKSAFPVATTVAVYFAVDSSVPAGHHTANVYISLPGGSPYQTNSISFAVGVPPASGELAAQRVTDGYRVWTSMQVAGTIIQQYSLTGPWSAQVMVDNASSPAATASFTLN